MRYIAMIQDTNLAPSTTLYVFESIDHAADVIRHAGSWRTYIRPDGTASGAMLLDSPSVFLYRVPNDSTALIAATTLRREILDGIENYADARLTTGPRGGVVRAW